MLGAAEFTYIGNVLMGVMAIGGVGVMLYAAGSAMTGTSVNEWKSVGRTETRHDEFKEAA
jgi:hypothetical protein